MWTDTDRSTLHCLCPTWTKQERAPVQKTRTNVKKILCLSCYILLIWFRELENHEKLFSRVVQGRDIFARWMAWLCGIQTGTNTCLDWLQQRRSGLSAVVRTSISTVASLLRGSWCSHNCPEGLYVALPCDIKPTPKFGQNTIILWLPFCRHSWFPLPFMLNSCELVLSQTSCIYNSKKRGKSGNMDWGLQNMPNKQWYMIMRYYFLN